MNWKRSSSIALSLRPKSELPLEEMVSDDSRLFITSKPMIYVSFTNAYELKMLSKPLRNHARRFFFRHIQAMGRCRTGI